jgi:NAD(P)-dependent dehydrogenase (short-subunit alcohol dehydrogenase family)
VRYARELASTSIKVNGAAPGRVATDFNRFHGIRTSEPAAEHPHATALTAFPRKRIVQTFTS